MDDFLLLIRWNNTPLDDAISHRNKETPHSLQYGALTKVVDALREHIEEWDLRENNQIAEEYFDYHQNTTDAMITEIKEKKHGLSPDIRNISHSLTYLNELVRCLW